MKILKENTLNKSRKSLTESVDWDYYDRFESIIDKYLPDHGEGETIATQIVTAVNKLTYKWYNDGDVFDNTSNPNIGWCNDISTFANWLYKRLTSVREILNRVYECKNTSDYEDIYEDLLKDLADKTLDENFLAHFADRPKIGSIYEENDGPFYYLTDDDFEEDEDYYNDDEYDEDDDFEDYDESLASTSKFLDETLNLNIKSLKEDFEEEDLEEEPADIKYMVGIAADSDWDDVDIFDTLELAIENINYYLSNGYKPYGDTDFIDFNIERVDANNTYEYIDTVCSAERRTAKSKWKFKSNDADITFDGNELFYKGQLKEDIDPDTQIDTNIIDVQSYSENNETMKYFSGKGLDKTKDTRDYYIDLAMKYKDNYSYAIINYSNKGNPNNKIYWVKSYETAKSEWDLMHRGYTSWYVVTNKITTVIDLQNGKDITEDIWYDITMDKSEFYTPSQARYIFDDFNKACQKAAKLGAELDMFQDHYANSDECQVAWVSEKNGTWYPSVLFIKKGKLKDLVPDFVHEIMYGDVWNNWNKFTK